jgi:hypothetical protein
MNLSSDAEMVSVEMVALKMAGQNASTGAVIGAEMAVDARQVRRLVFR